MDARFTTDFFEEIRDKEKAAALSPIVAHAKSANNESYMMDSDSVRTLCSAPDEI